MLHRIRQTPGASITILCRLIVLFILFGTTNLSAQQSYLLHEAVKQGDSVSVLAELRRGADVNSRQPLSITSLHLAVWSENTQILGILIAAGANLDARTKLNGATAMHYAALKGNTEILSLLVKAGGDVNIRTSPGRETPLHWAVTEGQMEALKFLLEEGADINSRNRDGHTVLKIATEREHSEIINWLLENDALN